MFVDRRNNPAFPNGNVLVVTAEGNAGYYEIGCMVTPLEKGYSVLGWNHPGFGGSTGTPWPKDDAESIDVVLQYATTQLGFQESDIFLFAWSIGGYTASWAAMNYPNLSGIALDATFDDLLPLAYSRMPQSWRSLVEETVRRYWDLPILRQLEKYPGPIQITRRTKEEIIVTEEKDLNSQRRTNRARDLLRGLLQFRFPLLMNQLAEQRLTQFLDTYTDVERLLLLQQYGAVDAERWRGYLLNEVEMRGNSFPLETVGADLSEEEKAELVLFLANHYMTDYDNTHCPPLPSLLFSQPRHPWQDP